MPRYILEKEPNTPKFLDRTQTAFHELHGTCDSVYRGLHQEGVGIEIRHTPTFIAAEEQALWAKDVLGFTNPKNLQYAVFFFILESDSVLGVRNSGDWGLLSLCILLTQIVSHIEGFHDVTTFR